MDEDTAPVTDTGEEQATEAEPASMDDVIEQEAEKDLSIERGDEEPEEDDEPEEAEPLDDEQVEDDDAEDELEEEEPLVEPEPVDTTKFAEVGLDALPEDYKPQSWAGFAKDVVDIIRGEVNKEVMQQQYTQAQMQQQVQAIDSDWESEIKELQKAGEIPKNDGETVNKVFMFMKENNEKHSSNPTKQIWSFETAYNLIKAKEVNSQRKDEIVQKRKARARATSGSSSSDGGNGLPAIRPGESMDDIIARELGL